MIDQSGERSILLNLVIYILIDFLLNNTIQSGEYYFQLFWVSYMNEGYYSVW